jgi:hypothetical protein
LLGRYGGSRVGDRNPDDVTILPYCQWSSSLRGNPTHIVGNAQHGRICAT